LDALKAVVNVFIKYNIVFKSEGLECSDDLVDDIFERTNRKLYIHNNMKPNELDDAILESIEEYRNENLITT
jgi:hypothetical protein